MWEFLFLITTFVYFAYEAITEAMTWDGNYDIKKIDDSKYHLMRFGEMFGILCCCVILGLGVLGSLWYVKLVLAVLLGFYLYERMFLVHRYDDPFYERTWEFNIGEWSFPQVPNIVQHAGALISIALYIYVGLID